MLRKLILFLFVAMMLAGSSSCNHNKIACPTYADSFPEAKKKTAPGDQQPQLPKVTKSTSVNMGPGR